VINPKTGELIHAFGDGGKADLRKDLGAKPQQPFNATSAPLVIKDVVVVGSSVADNPNYKEGTPGDVRGYDVKTGKLRWTFKVIPREGEFGVETWENRSWEYTGAANAWTNLTAVCMEGIGSAIISSATASCASRRKPVNVFGTFRLCTTICGITICRPRRCWPTSTSMADASRPWRRSRKEGFVFVFDRVTGQPVWPIQERPGR